MEVLHSSIRVGLPENDSRIGRWNKINYEAKEMEVEQEWYNHEVCVLIAFSSKARKLMINL